MFIITNLIESRVKKLILNHLAGNNYPEFCDGLFQTGFRKWMFGTLFLESRFENYPDSVILQKSLLLSNQSFKQNSAHIQSLSLTPKLSFEPFESSFESFWKEDLC